MPNMKESGIEWVGQIPKSWKVLRNKYNFTLDKSLIGNKWLNTQLLSLTKNGIKNITSEEQTGKVPTSYATYQIVKPNDLVMCLFDLDVSAVFSGISYYEGMISPAYKCFSCNENLLPQYADYYYQTVFVDRKYKRYSKNVRCSIGVDEFFALPMVIPPINVQKQIADFLDAKCSKIDALTADIEKQIETLEAYKKSLITEAVTKGLNSDVEMKDSGISWCPQIPKHWSVYRIADLYNDRNERGNDELPLLSVSINTGVSDKELSDDETDRVFVRSEDKSKYKRVYPGDITYNMMRAWQGAIGAVRVHGMVSPAYVVAKQTGGVAIDSRFIEALLRSPMGIEEINRYSYGIMDFRKRLYYPQFRIIKVFLPGIEEQKKIADYIDQKSNEIDTLIAKKHEQVIILSDYKKSIIYEYITGKKEVPM